MSKPGLYRVWYRPGREAQAVMNPMELADRTKMAEFLTKDEANAFIGHLRSGFVSTIGPVYGQSRKDYPEELTEWEDL